MARYVNVAAISERPARPYTDMPGRVADAERMAVRAKRTGADIVAFPEIYPLLGVPSERWPEYAEGLGDGPTLSHMAGVARREGMYIVWPTVTRDGSYFRNSSVLLDRQGQVAAIYHKMFPTIGEIEAGIRPGDGPVVVQTEFGKIGFAICFDLNFREIIEGTAKAGAEIIFFSSMYRGGLQVRMWAHEFGVYFVAAIGAELGQIVDMSGQLLAESTYEALATARINLDRRMLHMDYNWQTWDAMLEKYGTGVSVQYYTREAKYTVASELPDLTVDDLIREYNLESLEHYLGRARSRRREALGI